MKVILLILAIGVVFWGGYNQYYTIATLHSLHKDALSINTLEDKGMSMELKSVIENTKDIYMTDSMLSTLLDFERVMDNVDMYAFKNWINGELVKGPEVEKYWVTCQFMYPYKMMPDPKGATRLLDYNCKIHFQQTEMTYPVKVETPEDFEPGTKKPKKMRKKIWLVTIRMPKDLISDIRQGFIEIEGKNINMEDIDQAWEQDLDEEGAAQGDIADAAEDDLDLDLGL